MPDHDELLRAVPAPEAPDEREPKPVHVLAAGVGPAIARLTAKLVEAQKAAREAAPRSPLAAAVEALLRGIGGDDPGFRSALVSQDALDALRAALDTADAWRARAEAAIAVMEANDRLNALYATNVGGISQEAHERLLDDIDNTRLAAMAARRRYEETCRAG